MVKFSAYPPLDGLLDLACRDGVDIRPTLLRVLTDLYVQKPAHTAAEETQYVELALGLIDAVDAPTRAAVAAKLSAYSAAPAAIRRRLAEHGEHDRTPAEYGATLDAAKTGPAEPDVASGRDLVELFFAAGAKERCLILINLGAARAPAPRAAPAAADMIDRLEGAALQHKPGEFARLLERALGVNRALAERVTLDNSGEPIVVAAKALGMPAAMLQRILLVLNPVIGQSIERVHSLSQLYYDIDFATAERMVAIWRQAGGVRRPTHEPVHWDDERRSARATTTPAQHRLPRRGDETLPAWLKDRGRA